MSEAVRRAIDAIVTEQNDSFVRGYTTGEVDERAAIVAYAEIAAESVAGKWLDPEIVYTALSIFARQIAEGKHHEH